MRRPRDSSYCRRFRCVGKLVEAVGIVVVVAGVDGAVGVVDGVAVGDADGLLLLQMEEVFCRRLYLLGTKSLVSTEEWECQLRT